MLGERGFVRLLVEALSVRHRTGVAMAVGACLALTVTGCTAAGADASADNRALGLEGPWAQQFETAYASATTGYERAVLEDGDVTPAEYSQTRSHIERCLADSGLTITWDDRGGFELGSADGEYGDDYFDRSDPVLRKCEKRWDGSIRFLYEQVRRNPDQRDEATIMVACLRSSGVVPDGYDEQRWERENASGAWSYNDRSEEAQRCAVDPLGLWFQK